MSDNPVISIITPSFNRADVVHETADSIFRQTYPHWEWMIVDDGSTDNSWEIIQGFASQDPRVRIFKRDREPKGACACRNIAVEKSTGDYLIFLDTDDIMASFCLQQRLDAVQKHPEADFVMFPMLLFRNKPDDLKLLWNVDKPIDDIDRILMGDAVCQGTGTLWKKPSFKDIGMWDEHLLLWQDIELHLRSLLRPLAYVKRLDLRPDVFIRVSEVSLSRTGFHSYPKFQSRLRVLTETLEKVDKRGLIQNYRKGLRVMGTDILINAAKSGYYKDITWIFSRLNSYHLLDTGTEIRLRIYAWLRWARLYKLPVFSRMMERILLPDNDLPESTLTRIEYQDPIVS